MDTELKRMNPITGCIEEGSATKSHDAVPIGIATDISPKAATNAQTGSKHPKGSSLSCNKSCMEKIIQAMKKNVNRGELEASGVGQAHFIWEYRGHFKHKPELLNQSFRRLLFEQVLQDVVTVVFLFYYMFVIATTYRIYGSLHSASFLANDFVKHLLVDDEFIVEPPSSFHDVANGEEINQFAEFVAESVFPAENFYGIEELVENGFGDYRTFNGVNRVDGVAVRVKLAEHPETLSLAADEMTHDYHGHTFIEDTGIEPVVAQLQTYNGAGYLHFFEMEPCGSLSQNDKIQEHFLDFVANFSNDGHTRFISFDFVLISDHSKYDCLHPELHGEYASKLNYSECGMVYDMVTYMQLVFEIDQFQVVYPFVHQMSLDHAAIDAMGLLADVAVGASIAIGGLLIIFLARQQLYFFCRSDNYITMAIVAASIALIIEFHSMKHHFYEWENHDCAPAYDENGTLRHVDHHCVYDMFNDLKEYVTTEYCLAALQACLAFKFISFLSIFVSAFRVVGRTIALSLHKLAMFTIFWVVVTLCFANTFTIFFGHVLIPYNAIEQTFFTLFRAIIGDIDFDAFENTEWWWYGPILIALYAWIQVFVLLTMYISIVDESYSEASETSIAKSALRRVPFSGYNVLLSEEFLVMLCSLVVTDVEDAVEGKRKDDTLEDDILKEATVSQKVVAKQLAAIVRVQSLWRRHKAARSWRDAIKGRRLRSQHDRMIIFMSEHFKTLDKRIDKLEKSISR